MKPARRAVAALLALGLGALAYGLFAFASCHDGPGFCAGEYSSTHTVLYVLGGVVAGAAAALAADAFLDAGRRAQVAAFGAGAAVAVLLALALDGAS